MKLLKSKTAVIMALALALTAGASNMTFASSEATAKAQGDAVAKTAAVQNEMKSTLQGIATIENVTDSSQLAVKIDQQTLILNIDASTLFVDAITGSPSSLKDLKAGDRIYVYYSAMMTRSLPPQSSAVAVVTGIQKDQTFPKLMTIKKLVDSKDDQIRFLNTDEDMIVTVLKNSPITPFKTKQVVTYKDLRPGCQVFVWYDIVLESYPGQTAATKTVLIGTDKSTVKVPVQISVNGTHLDLGPSAITQKNGQYMVPLKDVSKALGFKLTWNPKTHTASIDNGTVKTTVTVGKDAYYKASSKALGLTNTFAYNASPEIIGGKLYVPAELFKLLYSSDDAVKVSGDVLSITNLQK